VVLIYRLPVRRMTIAILLLMVFDMTIRMPLAYAQTVAGTVTAINGTVTITRAGHTFPATNSAPIEVGDQIITGTNGRVTITLTDRSQLELVESSTLLVSENTLNSNGTRARTAITLLGGLVRSFVSFTPGSPPNFEVHTPNAVAAARGTTYDTDYQNNVNRLGYAYCKEFSDVSVFNGTVEVNNPKNTSAPSVTLQSGQKTTVPCGLAAAPAAAISAAAKTGGGGAAGGLSVGAIAGIAGAVVTGGVLGGYSAAGGFSSGTSTAPVVASPSQ
jgi:FecR protein